MRALGRKGAGMAKPVTVPAWKLKQQAEEKEREERKKAEEAALAARKEEERAANAEKMEAIRNAAVEDRAEQQEVVKRVAADADESGVVTTSPLADNVGVEVKDGNDLVLCKGAVGALDDEEQSRLEEKRLGKALTKNVDPEAEARLLREREEKERRRIEAEQKLKRKKRESRKIVEDRELKEAQQKIADAERFEKERKTAAADFLSTLLGPKKM